MDFHLDTVVKGAVGERKQHSTASAVVLNPHRHGEVGQLAQHGRMFVE